MLRALGCAHAIEKRSASCLRDTQILQRRHRGVGVRPKDGRPERSKNGTKYGARAAWSRREVPRREDVWPAKRVEEASTTRSVLAPRWCSLRREAKVRRHFQDSLLRPNAHHQRHPCASSCAAHCLSQHRHLLLRTAPHSLPLRAIAPPRRQWPSSTRSRRLSGR